MRPLYYHGGHIASVLPPMALMVCPDCSKTHSTLARQCPQCGRPVEPGASAPNALPIKAPPPPPPLALQGNSEPASLATEKDAKERRPRVSRPQKVLLTDQERKEQNVATAALAGCSTPVLVLLAALFALIPFVGWISSIALLFFAFGSGLMPILMASGLSSSSNAGDYWLEGECPYCSHSIKVMRRKGKESDTGFHQCATCKERVLVKDDSFFTILKVYSDPD